MALVIDCETASEDWSKIDSHTQKILREKARRTDPEITDESIDQSLGLSPLTGMIIAIGLVDSETDKGAVYYQTGKNPLASFNEGLISFQPMGEKEMLERFWEVAKKYKEFVTYNGRGFDMPYLMIRSAIHKIKPSKDLMRGRYLNQQAFETIHIDLYDQLTHYGAAKFPSGGSLHMVCRAFGINTPKDGEIDGAQVSEYFRQERYKEIAQYNARDVEATKILYNHWRTYLRFS